MRESRVVATGAAIGGGGARKKCRGLTFFSDLVGETTRKRNAAVAADVRGGGCSRVWCTENRCPRAQLDRETRRSRKRSTEPVRVRQNEFSGWLARSEDSREQHQRGTARGETRQLRAGGESCRRHHRRARVLPAAGPALAARARHVEVDFGIGSTFSWSCSRTRRQGGMRVSTDHLRILDPVPGHRLGHRPELATRRSRRASNGWWRRAN